MTLVFADTCTAEGRGTGDIQLFVFTTQGRVTLWPVWSQTCSHPPVPVFPELVLLISHHTQLSGPGTVLVRGRVDMCGHLPTHATLPGLPQSVPADVSRLSAHVSFRLTHRHMLGLILVFHPEVQGRLRM